MYRLGVFAIFVILAHPTILWSQEPTPISADKLLSWLHGNDPPLVLDIRGHQAYRSGTLPGAFDAGTDPMGYLPDHSGDPLVLLSAERADALLLQSWMARLVDAGHTVWLLTGGLTAWIKAGGFVEIPQANYARPGRRPFLIPKGLCEGNEPAQVFK